STLLDALVRALRKRGETVGIVAVDPSSQRTGGALLGDRFRVRAGASDPGVFLRSMAARDHLGGLADGTWAAVTVMAAVFDRVFVETVGVGQSESEVANLVDTLLFVAQPGAGDVLQFMKAGVLELPDLFVVNKADLGAPAERTAHELEAGLGLGEADREGFGLRVLKASARDGSGIDAVLDALDAHRTHLAADGLHERRARACQTLVLDGLTARYGSYGLEALGGRNAVRARIQEAQAPSPFGLLRAFGREIEDALRKPSA
ncbi:MAG: methylmalonyl Co-A mutase-associated GTPase MeaB, partial [Myxococcales bacterium]|nr:methylmalonyl Co-A mutase-associated GTPase MeaB [Myxococcales bacterium]